jgi:hypothetical protein
VDLRDARDRYHLNQIGQGGEFLLYVTTTNETNLSVFGLPTRHARVVR